MAVSRRAGLAMLALAAPLALAGCISFGGGKPLPSLMTLTPTVQAPPGPEMTSKTSRTIAVFAPDIDRMLATTRVPVQLGDSSIAYLTGGAWAERPERLFQELLAETIRARGKLMVLGEDRGQAQIQLSGRLEAMGYDAPSHSVVVRFDAQSMGPNGATVTRRFEAVEKNIGPTAADIGPALNVAANDVAGQVADWVDQ